MRTLRIIDGTVAVIVGLGLGLVLLSLLPEVLDWYWYAAAFVGMAGLVAVYLVGYRAHLLVGRDQRRWWWQVALVGCLFLASWGIANLMFLQVIGNVLVWATMRRARDAVLWTVIVSWGAWLGSVIGTGFDPQLTLLTTSINVISTLCSMAYGATIRHSQGIAAEKTRLYDELRRTQDALNRASAHAGALEERARLSRDLHDTLAQSVSGLVMVASTARTRLAAQPGAAAVDDLRLIEQIAREVLAEARSVVVETSPLQSTGDAATSIGRVVDRVRRESGLAVDADLAPTPVDRATELVLVRCAQEGLANVRKHAHATRATVRLGREAAGLILQVEDDGTGPLVGSASGEGGYGLAGMRDRVELVGGSMMFGPGPGGGAHLRISLPMAGGTAGQGNTAGQGSTVGQGSTAWRVAEQAAT